MDDYIPTFEEGIEVKQAAGIPGFIPTYEEGIPASSAREMGAAFLRTPASRRDLIRRSFEENDPLMLIEDDAERRYIEHICQGDVDGGEARKKRIGLANYYSMHHPEAAGFIYQNIEGAIKRYEGKEMSVDQAYASVAEMFQPQDYSMNRYAAAAASGSVGAAKSAFNAVTFLSKNLAGFLAGWFEKGFDLKYSGEDALEEDEKIFSSEGARQVIDEYWQPYRKALTDTENFYSEQMRMPEGGWVLNSDGFADFVENGSVALVNYLPQLAGQLAMTMGTGSVAPLAFVYGVDGYYDIKEDEELGDVSEGKALLYGLGIGLVNGALEKITLDIATGKVTEKFVKEGLKKGLGNAVKYLAITSGKEGAEEGIEEFAENVLDIGFGRRGDTDDWTAGRWMKELFQGVPEAGLLGAVTGFGIGTMPMGAMKKLAVENERARQVIESRIGDLEAKENLTPEEEADLYWLKLLGDADPEDVRKAAFVLMHQEINNKLNNAETVNGINLKSVSGNLSNYFSNIKDAIRALYRKAFLDRGNNRSFVNYAEVTDEERKMLSELSGADLSGAQFHGLDETGIRHMDRRHGEDESTAGQIPVTENDVLKIPQIVQETKPTYKGKNDVGNHVFQYHWKQGDEFFYLEEYRNGRGKLVGVSLWKKEGTKATPTSTNESDGKFTPEAIRPRTLDNNIAQDSEKASESSASTESGTIQASEAAEEGEAEASARAERELKLRRELPHNPADTAAEIEKWQKLFPNANIQTTDAWTPEQIRILRQRGVLAPEKAQGMFDIKTNTVILNVSNLRPSEVGFKVLHEVGLHYGIRQAFGDEAANRLFLAVFDAMQDSPFMQRIIDAYKLRAPMLDENGEAIYNPDGTPLFDDMTDAQKEEAAEEFLAFAAETYGVPIDEIYADNRAEIDKWGREHGRDTHDWNEKRRMTREWMAETGFKPERPGWWKQLISQIRVWLAEHGFGHLREADIETIIQDAFRGAQRQALDGRGAGLRSGTEEARYSLERKPNSVEDFLSMKGHKRPARLDFGGKVSDMFNAFKEHIIDGNIVTPDGYRLEAKEGHFFSFCCGKVNGKRKGFIEGAKDSEDAIRMVKQDLVKPEDLSGFQRDRIRNLLTYVDVLKDPDFSYREGNKIVYGKKYDDIEKGNGYISVVLNQDGDTIYPVSSSFKNLSKNRFDGKNVKWYEQKSPRSASDTPGGTREGTSEEYSTRVQEPNIAQDSENASENDDKSRFSVSPVWTGSAADYDQPELYYIGTGTGTQVYGWGLYGSSSRRVAEKYAEEEVENKAYEGRNSFSIKGIAPGEMSISEFGKKTYPDNPLKAAVAGELATASYSATSMDDVIYNMRDRGGYERSRLGVSQEEWDATVQEVLKDSEFKPLQRNLYRQTFWPGRKENLIYWEEGFNATQREQIQKQAQKEGITLPDDLLKFHDFDWIYKGLSKLLGSEEAASKFLYRAGMDGVTYMGDAYRSGVPGGVRDYVAFSDKDIRVDEHIRFSIDTPQFKNWFKDSKVVDNDGKPLVVYHDTNAKIYINKETGENWDDLDWKAREEWDNRDDWDQHWIEQDFNTFSRVRARRSVEYPGFFFSPAPDPNHEYGNRRIAAYLSIQNPAINPKIEDAGVYDDSGEKAMLKLIEQGYDGIIRKDDDGNVEEYIAFYPEQIKSVDNVGTFDPNNPDIRYSVSPVWTGSAADYDQPSLFYVGTGEGAQVYGWGLYGSSSRKVAEWYADADYNRKNKGETAVFHIGKEKIQMKGSGNLVIGSRDGIYNEVRAAAGDRIDDIPDHALIHALSFTFWEAMTEGDQPDIHKGALSALKKFKKQYEEDSSYVRAAALIADLTAEDNGIFSIQISDVHRNLYQQTFWPHKKENLIYYEEGLTFDQRQLIKWQAEREGLDLGNLLSLSKQFDVIYNGLSDFRGLVDILGSPKAVSEFLYRAGIDGVTYIGDSSGARNFVAFSDSDIQVDDHIRYSLTDIDGNEAARQYIDIIKPYVPFDVHDKDGAYYAQILKEKAGVDLEPEDAMQIAQEAWHERRKASVKKSWDQAYTYFAQSNPLFDFLVGFAGADFKIRPAHRFEGEKFTGSFIAPEYVKYSEKREQGDRETDWSYNRYNQKRERALKSAKGLHSDEAAAAYVRQFGGDELEIEQEIIDLLRDLKRTDIRSDYAKFKRENFARDRLEQAEYEAMMEDIFQRELDDKVIAILSAGEPVVTPDWVAENRDVYKELYKRLLSKDGKEAPYTPSQKDIEAMNSAIVQEGADAATYAKAYKEARAASAQEWMEKMSELRKRVIEGKENAMKLQREASALLKRAGLEGDRSFSARIINLMGFQTEARRQKAFDQLMSDILAAGTAAKQMKVYDRLRERLQQLGRRADVGRKAIGVRDEVTQIQIDKIRDIAAMSTYEIAARQSELQDAINAAQEHGESSVAFEEEMALLSKYGDLANKTAAELTLALADLNELAVTGKRKIRERLMERQGQDRMRIQESVDLINGGNFATMGDLYDLENRRNQKSGTRKEKVSHDLFTGFNLWGKLTALNLAGNKNIRDTVFYRMMEQTHECARNQDTMNEKHQNDTLAAIDRIFGTKGAFERAAKLQELRKVQDKTGVMRRFIDKDKKEDYRRMSLDEARELLKDYDSKTAAGERPALKDYEAEAIRHQLLVYDRKLDKKSTVYLDGVTEKLIQMAEEERERGEKTVILPIPKYTAESELKLSQMQALYQYLMWQQKNTRYKMVFNGWTEDSIKQLEGFMTPETKAFGGWMTEQLEADRADIDPVYERLYMTAFPHVESYFPAVYDVVNNSKLGNAQGVDLGAAGAGGQAMAFSPGALRQRVFHMSDLRNVDALNVFQNHRMIMTHFVTHGEAARELRAVFANKDVRRAIEQQLGQDRYKSLEADIADFINGGRIQADSAWWLRGLYNVAVRSKMMINITSGIKQTLGGLTYLQDIPLKDFVAGVNYAVAHPKEVWQTLGKTDYFQNRWHSGSNQELRMLLDRAGKNGQMDVLMEKADTLSSIPLRLGDAGAVLFGGYAVYRYTYQQGIKRGLSEAEAKRRALLEWEMSTERTQQSSQVHMQNNVQKGTTLERIFATYLSNQILMWNHYAPRFFKGDFKGGARGMAAAAITSVAMTTMSQLFRKGIWVDDWEFWDYFWDYLSDVLNGSGAAGVILGRAIEGANAYGRGANVLQSDEERAFRAGRNIIGDLSDEEYEKAFLDAIDILTVLGYFWDVPITPALSAVREGRKTKSFWQRLFNRDEDE